MNVQLLNDVARFDEKVAVTDWVKPQTPEVAISMLAGDGLTFTETLSVTVPPTAPAPLTAGATALQVIV